MLKSYDMSKDETLSLLDKFHTLDQNTGKTIQTFKKAVVKRFEKIEKGFIENDYQGHKIQGQDLASSVLSDPRMTYTEFQLHTW